MAEALNGISRAALAQAEAHSAHGVQQASGASFSSAFDTALHARSQSAGPVTSKRHDSDDHIHERALAINAYRLQLLASNIANADTPGYKARDIDVARALQERTPLYEIPLQYVTPAQPSIDGNTVELDIQRKKFAEASVMYEFELDRVSGHYKHMMELFKDLTL